LVNSQNVICLGYNAGTSASPSGAINSNNVMCLGDNSIQNIYQKVSSSVTSDGRDKIDIMPICIGLDFVNQLKPKCYRMNDRTHYENQLYDDDGLKTSIQYLQNDGSKADTYNSCGLIAQELKEIENVHCDNEMFVNSTNPEKLAIKYETLVPVLIKAIQELTARIVVLESA
jgi:hypothetical protein